MLEKGLFPDEEPSLPPKKPQWVKPMGKVHNRLAWIGSWLAASAIWWLIRNDIEKEPQKNLRSTQTEASKLWHPITHTQQETVRDKIEEALTGKKEVPVTTTINPLGKDPAFQVTTSQATITGNEAWEIKEIIPKIGSTETPPTPEEAQSMVNEALNDAAKKTLPKEEKPLIPPALKEN